ncbi:bifunctional alpha,alpha-trehalose-phosphate synthase (UDP-forming)/trehalose-phosphatase [Desulfatitalea alkaliphila]|uniref:Bifunctional alpha,alpha-trehalose-phosphate synthase (UDP-forming)/trehalose-phosphatase n=1 Tax=Desulfatitalea alkaliphila TaxID=2929485 RepID=A0AA41UGY2_9BACT|nr:bifunctional alpha,alpha-trehalose-phosphate synthase (UDP-forming)/trehalose-phosphatase [Desulfatitalea alkaliphila]MCJ8499020.1 bifunctional alpha,alpha-trehalose-phosphate synthase (UDP-forming)/trehalose-phosphatase [Desulfatitalea alkaliphila]
MVALINVSNRLPVTIANTIKPSSGGLVSALEGYRKTHDFMWVGWSGGPVDSPRRQRELAEELKSRFGYHPLFISQQDIEAYYTGFSNSSLWPLLHYLPSYSRFDHNWFEAYKKVNFVFAENIAELAEKDALVWVHDYHLMLLPRLLHELRPDLRIGYFLHTPFPSYEIFRCHPNRQELLEGLLGADLIGFHTSGYLRHFRSTVLRLLGRESRINTIAGKGHDVTIGVYPISIPTDKFLQKMTSAAYSRHLEEYRRAYAGKKVVIGVERLDYTKGVPRRLEAIEAFLKRTGRKDVVFIFINVPSRESVPAYQALRREIEHKVSRINGNFASIGNIPVHFIHQSVNFSRLCALYTLADVAMVTPLVDGMNLVAKEYLICKPDGDGVLILSEFAGAAQELPQASIVNPYDTAQMARALENALNRTPEERQKRLAPMRRRILRYNAQRWAGDFIADLAGVDKSVEKGAGARTIDPQYFPPLAAEGRWAFFLDYDGTLSDLRKNPPDAYPSRRLHDLFDRMAHVPNLTVFLLSGRMREDMDQWFDGYGFHLIAEHGYYYRPPTSETWAPVIPGIDLEWKERVLDILLQYSDTTPGSFVEQKAASLVWHYVNAEPEFGGWKAQQLVVELQEMLSNLPVRIHHGRKIVEVHSIFINKGVVCSQLKPSLLFDHALYAGDDETDETMFDHAGEGDLSIKVGPGDTAARYCVSSPQAMQQLLARFLVYHPVRRTE